MSKIFVSFFLLMVLQVLVTEGEDTSQKGKAPGCPEGMVRDGNGKCVANLKYSIPTSDLLKTCSYGYERNRHGICQRWTYKSPSIRISE
ncbi:UNVERIFIED_CONTAM: hypothetical protein PYX00_003939 [Menopon gallinae]|uniref:Secreted protein n=1 Tax=Menopon gallinae TaxID=328185 RepID=A0AAW2I2G3_9NEOP